MRSPCCRAGREEAAAERVAAAEAGLLAAQQQAAAAEQAKIELSLQLAQLASGAAEDMDSLPG